MRPRHGPPPSILRLRECGLLRAATARFHSVLNVRIVAMKREIKDKHQKYDERPPFRIKAFELLDATDAAYTSGAPRATVRRLDEEHQAALDKLELAMRCRRERIARLDRSIALCRKALQK